MVDYETIIQKYYPADDVLRRLLIHHSRQVADRCLEIASHSALALDKRFLLEAAMLHDIGIRWCHAPSIYCEGTEPYICHGSIGGQLLRGMGLEQHARVCERHTGAGITPAQIAAQQMPLDPALSYVPETLEEQLVCFADKFYSKSHPDRVLTVDQAAESLARFGSDGVERFRSWAQLFGLAA